MPVRATASGGAAPGRRRGILGGTSENRFERASSVYVAELGRRDRVSGSGEGLSSPIGQAESVGVIRVSPRGVRDFQAMSLRDPEVRFGRRIPGRARKGPNRLRFGDFEFDPGSRELKGPAGAVRLQPQPARLLELLLEHGGVVVSREEVRRHLWPEEIHVEFDQSMNTCVKRIRSALGDSAEAPSYIETLPRLGYRFMVPVAENAGGGSLLAARGGAGGPRTRPAAVAAIVLVAAMIAIAASVAVWRLLDASPCGSEEPPARVFGAGEPALVRGAQADRGPRPGP